MNEKMEECVSSDIRISRPLYDQEKLRKDFHYEATKTSFIRKYVCGHGEIRFKKTVLNTLPIVKWLSEYDVKGDLMSDFVSGFTVAVMHIPQGCVRGNLISCILASFGYFELDGALAHRDSRYVSRLICMAYALLGNVPPIVGIYMAFFPVLVYTIFGTSRHNSMGTFAVVCLMTGKAVLENSHHPSLIGSLESSINSSNNSTLPTHPNAIYSPIEVATTVTFIVAIFQIAMYILRLGAVSVILSDTLVSGFTTGAAVQVLVSQIKDLLGLNIPRHKGYFTVINTFRDIFYELRNLNYAAAAISAITIAVCTFNNTVLKPFVAKFTSYPVPIELIIIVFGTIASTTLNLEEIYNVKTVGVIPTGLPSPTLPKFELVPSVLLDGFTIALVSYTVTLSMALIFAQKLNYEVDANQELLAQGAGNVVGSFFSCMPFSASLSRSLIQQTVGGKTQIASVVSCSLLLAVLLWIGPYFEPLPKSILASVIVFALKGMLMQVTALFKFWNLSKMDAFIWISTFLTVVFVSIDIGLYVGIMSSLITIFLLGFKPYTCLLGHVPHTDLFLDITQYKGASEIRGIKIFSYCGGLNFATRSHFTSQLYKLIELDPQKELIHRNKLCKLQDVTEGSILENKDIIRKIEALKKKINISLKCLILDLSSVSYIDPSGAAMLKLVGENFNKIGVPLFIAASSDAVYDMLKKCKTFDETVTSIQAFATIKDAVHYAAHLIGTSDSNISIISRL